MKIELLTKGNMQQLFTDIPFRVTYSGENYSVVEIEKSDLPFAVEGSHEDLNGWYYYSKGARTGSACDFFRINGHDIIGWAQTGKNSYKTLLDYFSDEIGINSDEDICDYAVSLAKANGMSLSKLFKTCEG